MNHAVTLITALLAAILPARAADLLIASKDSPLVPIIVYSESPPCQWD